MRRDPGDVWRLQSKTAHFESPRSQRCTSCINPIMRTRQNSHCALCSWRVDQPGSGHPCGHSSCIPCPATARLPAPCVCMCVCVCVGVFRSRGVGRRGCAGTCLNGQNLPSLSLYCTCLAATTSSSLPPKVEEPATVLPCTPYDSGAVALAARFAAFEHALFTSDLVTASPSCTSASKTSAAV